MKERSSNIELLRILAMMAIVLGHCLRQNDCFLALPNMIFASGMLRIAVNVFLIVGCWFMVDATFSWKRVFSLYRTLAFYSIPISVLMFFVNPDASLRLVLRGVFPFFGCAVWFASAYISLIILSPFLQHIFTLPRTRQRTLVVALLLVIVVPATLQPCQGYVADLLWFPCVYLMTGYVKHSARYVAFRGKWLALLFGCVLYGALALGARWGGPLAPLADGWLWGISTLPNLLCAFAVFTFFVKLDIGVIRPINFLAKSTFAVYIVHQTPAFMSYEWKRIWCVSSWSDVSTATLVLLLTAGVLGTFGAVTLVDTFVRRKLFR